MGLARREMDGWVGGGSGDGWLSIARLDNCRY